MSGVVYHGRLLGSRSGNSGRRARSWRPSSRHGSKPEALTELIAHYPDRVLLAELDVRREDEAQQATGEAVAAFGGIDVVVNSAGYGLFEPVEKRQISRLEIYSTPTFLGCLTWCAQRCRYFEDSVQVM